MNLNISPTKGFTLIELMVVVVIVAIFAAIAIPSYQSMVRRGHAAQAQDQLQQIAIALDKHKSRNFSYEGFTIPPDLTVLPKGATGTAVKYNFALVAGTTGQTWVLTAESKDTGNYSFLMSSTGLRCKNTKWDKIDTANLTCGTGHEEW